MANRLKYLKFNFISTLIATIPFSLIFYQRNDALFIVNFLRVLRIVKIWPFYRFLQLLKIYNVNFIRWIEVLITYYFVAHILAGVMLCEAMTK